MFRNGDLELWICRISARGSIAIGMIPLSKRNAFPCSAISLSIGMKTNRQGPGRATTRSGFFISLTGVGKIGMHVSVFQVRDGTWPVVFFLTEKSPSPPSRFLPFASLKQKHRSDFQIPTPLRGFSNTKRDGKSRLVLIMRERRDLNPQPLP